MSVPKRTSTRVAPRSASPSSPTQLEPRYRLAIEYMVYGLAHESLRERLEPRYMPAGHDEDGAPLLKLTRPELGQALTLEDAATVLGIKLRAARAISQTPAFQRLLASETEAFRTGARARALRRVDAIAHDPGRGRAADRRVQLAAAQTILGENDRGTTVNVSVGPTIVPGIVVQRYRPEPHTIEHLQQEEPQ